jgi:hypothetical protein
MKLVRGQSCSERLPRMCLCPQQNRKSFFPKVFRLKARSSMFLSTGSTESVRTDG